MNNCPISGLPCDLHKCLHITDIDKNKNVLTMDFCQTCVSKLQSIADLLKPTLTKLSKPKIVEKEMEICRCGWKIQDIVKTGRLGCPNCYNVFSKGLQNVYKQNHGALKHVGKRPLNPITPESYLKETKKLMDESIVKEEYEIAAFHRDKIKTLEVKLNELEQATKENNSELAQKINIEIKELINEKQRVDQEVGKQKQ